MPVTVIQKSDSTNVLEDDKDDEDEASDDNGLGEDEHDKNLDAEIWAN